MVESLLLAMRFLIASFALWWAVHIIFATMYDPPGVRKLEVTLKGFSFLLIVFCLGLVML